MNRSYLAASGSILLWGLLAAITVSLNHVPTFLSLGLSLLVGGITGLFFQRPSNAELKKTLLAVYGVFGFHFCLFIAMRIAPPVEANLVIYLWPLFIVLFTPLFFKQHKLEIRHILGGVAGFTGVVLVMSGGKLSFDLQYLPGYLLSFASAMIWSTYSLISKRMAPFNISNITLGCISSGVFALLVHFILEESYIPVLKDIPFIIILGAGPLGAAFYLWNIALKNGDPRIIGSMSYITPLLSTIILALSLGQKLSGSTFIAMILIVGGAAISSINLKRNSNQSSNRL